MNDYKTVNIAISDANGASSSKATFAIDNEADLIQKLIYNSQDFYERDLLDFVREIVPSVDVFVDIGANIGNHSVYFGLACNAEVYAFEPNGPNFGRLVRNLTLSGLSKRMHTFNVAVGAEPGHVVSAVGENSTNTGGAGVRDAEEATSGSVPLVRADDWLSHLLVDRPKDMLMKIDVEGMEVEVLKGALDLIDSCRPVLICEVSEGHNMGLVRNLLADRNYLIFASFFKSATFVILPHERVAELLPLMNRASWQAARCYVEYCRLARVVALSRKPETQLANLLG